MEQSKARSTSGLAVNDTPINRLLVRLALKTLGRLYARLGACTRISQRLIIRSGDRVDLTEVATMKFVADNTAVPVPKVYCAFQHKGKTYILMQRIRGEPITVIWKTLDEAGRERVFEHLRGLMDDMRALKPPEDRVVSSCIRGSLFDFRIAHSRSKRFGPFDSVQAFHHFLREGLQPAEHPDRVDDEDWKEVKDMVALQEGEWPATVFTHGDLNPGNILVKDDKVVGIIDWEFAGWYPHYWEYTSAWCGNLSREFWQEQLSRFLVPYPVETKMELTRQRYWGDFG